MVVEVGDKIVVEHLEVLAVVERVVEVMLPVVLELLLKDLLVEVNHNQIPQVLHLDLLQAAVAAQAELVEEQTHPQQVMMEDRV